MEQPEPRSTVRRRTTEKTPIIWKPSGLFSAFLTYCGPVHPRIICGRDFVDLNIRDLAEWLDVSEKTVRLWIRERTVPCYRIRHKYRFNRSEINEWILGSRPEFVSKLVDSDVRPSTALLTELVCNGGVYAGIAGDSVADVLANVVRAIKIPGSIDRGTVLSALLDREKMMSTAIGRGIALPHPRNPVITDIRDAAVSICYLANPIDFNALDGSPVHTLFVLLTYSPRRHLEALAKISYMCRLEEFRMMLEGRASEKDVTDFILGKESAMTRGEPLEP